MSIESLMQPRYKVIADYPACFYQVGRILIPKTKDVNLDAYNYYDCVEAPSSITVYKPGRYPHLFKKLEWYEEREIADMPEYLKFKNNGKVKKVQKYHLSTGYVVFDGGRTRRINKDWTPATEQEFLTYQ